MSEKQERRSTRFKIPRLLVQGFRYLLWLMFEGPSENSSDSYRWIFISILIAGIFLTVLFLTQSPTPGNTISAGEVVAGAVLAVWVGLGQLP